jgi:hypothetical protein
MSGRHQERARFSSSARTDAVIEARRHPLRLATLIMQHVHLRVEGYERR